MNKNCIHIHIQKTLVFVIIREFILHTLTTLSFYTHLPAPCFFSEEVLKAVIRNTDVIIFMLLSYRKYIRNYVVFSNSIARVYLTNIIRTLES